MNGRFTLAVAGVSGLGVLAIALLSAGSKSSSSALVATGVVLVLLAGIGLGILGRAVVLSERRGRRP